MQVCTIYHTGIYMSADGIVKNNKVFLEEENNKLYFPEEMFMAREECEGGLIQFEVDGKWGFADIYTGEIKIRPTWDYAGPFYKGYAHVALGAEVENYDGVKGGKHGYINTIGEIIIPLEYDDAEEIPYRQYFMVARNENWGMIDQQNNEIIPFNWDRIQRSYKNDLLFCSIRDFKVNQEGQDKQCEDMLPAVPKYIIDYVLKWGVYDQNFTLIVKPDVEEIMSPMIKEKPRSKKNKYYEKYYILKRKGRFGIICNDGRWIADIKLSKKQAKAMINFLSRDYRGKLYI